MNRQQPVQTLQQRRALAAYTAAQRGVDAARQVQIELERLLAAKKAGEEARSARYQAGREYAMRCAERDRILRAWRRPASLSLRHRIRAEITAGKHVWQQIAAEVAAAPFHMKVTVAVFFGAGAGAWVAVLCGWLA
jgi:hypothetical protein